MVPAWGQSAAWASGDLRLSVCPLPSQSQPWWWPIILQCPEGLHCRRGQDFVLQCSKVKGTPLPRITWLLNGETPCSTPEPLALPEFLLSFPIYHSESFMREKEAWSIERAWDLGVCQCLAGDTGQVFYPFLSLELHLQDENEATYLSGESQVDSLIRCLAHRCTSNSFFSYSQAHK